MNLKKLKDTEYLKCVKLLSKLIDLDDDTKGRILNYFQDMGVSNFFLHLESVNLPLDIYEKLKNIKSVIEVFDREGRQVI